jgi:hypothetical protein
VQQASENGQPLILGGNITLNSTRLTHASQEYVAATIAHEMVHAYLNADAYLDPTGPSITEDFMQHEAVITVYINDIKTIVKRINPSISDKDCYGLALYGTKVELTNPTLFNALLTKYGFTQQQLIDLNDAHRRGTKGVVCPIGDDPF